MEKIHERIFREVLRDAEFPCKRNRDSISALARACNLVVQDAGALWFCELRNSLTDYIEKAYVGQGKQRDRGFYEGVSQRYIKKSSRSFSFEIKTPNNALEYYFDVNRVFLDFDDFDDYSRYFDNRKKYETLTEKIKKINLLLILHRKDPIKLSPFEELVSADKSESWLNDEEKKKLQEAGEDLKRRYSNGLNKLFRNFKIAYSDKDSVPNLLSGLLNFDTRRERKFYVKEVTLDVK